MCGVAGFLDRRAETAEADALATVAAMAQRLHHRGPDDRGTWADASAGIALGHQRLSIVDLSPAGHQPMVSASGRFVLAYNGEVYNFEALRRELEALGCGPFRGHSDSEVVLEACEAWGVEAAVQRFNGMFAFAVWDRKTRTLTLGRDRLGIKPLYWGCFGALTVFGSQPAALRAHPGWTPRVDRDALTCLLRHNYVMAPLSIYAGVRKVRPGHLVVLAPDAEPEERCYWDMRSLARQPRPAPGAREPGAAVTGLENLLHDAVGRRMVADVPLGAFLSGGIDSATVAALMQAQSDRPVKTFSVGFREQGFNEAEHAKAVAGHLGTEHTEFYVSPRDARDIIPDLPRWWDEPFSDSSQIPTHLLSALTRRHVTVALSGDGGDELFAGYTRYFTGNQFWDAIRRVPRPARRAFARLALSTPPHRLTALARAIPWRWRPAHFGDRLHKLARTLDARCPDAFYQAMVSHWPDPAAVVRDGAEPPTPLRDPTIADDVPDFTDRMQFLDTMTYLPDDILTKVDRASMGASLEARVPLLDHRVVEHAWALPRDLLIRQGKGKWLMREVLARHVPRHLFERPKMGFGVPIGDWLRGPLRDWAEALLDENRLRHEGFFDPGPVRARWREHLEGTHNWQYLIWDILMFQAWQEAAF